MKNDREEVDGKRETGPLTYREAEMEFVRVMRRWRDSDWRGSSREKREARQQQEDGGAGG